MCAKFAVHRASIYLPRRDGDMDIETGRVEACTISEKIVSRKALLGRGYLSKNLVRGRICPGKIREALTRSLDSRHLYLYVLVRRISELDTLSRQKNSNAHPSIHGSCKKTE